MARCRRRASSLRKPSAACSQPAATGLIAAVLRPRALNAASSPVVMTVLPTSVSVPVTKNVLAMTVFQSQIPDLISRRQLAGTVALQLIRPLKSAHAFAPGETGRAAAIHIVRTERFQFSRQLAQLGIFEHDVFFIPRHR